MRLKTDNKLDKKQCANNSIFNSPAYKRSQKAYYFQRLFEYFVFALVCEPYLSKLLTSIGVLDSLVGVIGTLVSLSAFFELISIIIVSKMKNVKRTVITGHAVSQLLFMSMFFVPFMPFGVGIKTVVITTVLILGYAFFYMISSILYKWKNSFISPEKRSTFSGGVESISIFVGMIFSVLMGMVIDFFEAKGDLNKAFLFLGIAVFVFALGNFVSLMFIKNRDINEMQDKSKEKISYRDVIDNTFKNKNYVNVVIMTSLYAASNYLSSGFMGTFKMNDLMMSVTLIQVISVVASVIRIVLSRPLGMYSDKYSYVKGMKLAFFIAAIGYIFNMFTTRGTWWCVIIYTITSGVAFTGTNINNFNIVYSYVDEKYYVQALAIKNSIAGLFGFGASVLGGKILNAVQQNGNMVFGISMYGQQLLSFISLLILVVTILFVHTVVEKQDILKQ